MKSILMKILPHAVAILIFLLIANTFFTLLGDEYVLKQNDLQNIRGMSKELADYRYMNNDEALWSNNMFGGMPGYQTSLNYPSNLLVKADKVLKLFLWSSKGSLYMCMFGFYILMLCLRVRPWLGIIAAIGFGLSTFNILYLGAGHVTKVNALGYMAPTLGALILAYRGKWLLGGALFALFFGLHLMANHLQMTYYLAFLLGAVGLTELIRLVVQKQAMLAMKASAIIIVGAVLGLVANAGNMWTTYKYSKFTTRGATELTIAPEGQEEALEATDGLRDEYILEYNFGKGEDWAMVIPNAKGGSSSVPITENKEAMQVAPREIRENLGMFRQYWGEQASSAGAFYYGAAMFFFFILGLIFIKDWLKWPFLVLSVLCVYLSLNDMNFFNDFFIHKFPMYNKFRDSKMIHVLLQIMIPALGMLFIDGLLTKGVEVSARKWLWIGSGAILVIMVMVMANPTITGPLMSKYDGMRFAQLVDQYKSDPATVKMINKMEPALEDVRKVIFQKDAQRALLLMLVSAGLLVAISFNKLKWYLFAGVFAIVVAADMWTVSARYMNEDKYRNPQTEKMEYLHYEKWDNQSLPFDADKCDLFILNQEKAAIPDFDAQASKLQNAMQSAQIYLNVKNKKKMEEAAQFGVLQLNTNYRVLLPTPGVFSDASTAFFHKSIGGYHGAKLKRYQELIDFYLRDEIGRITESFSSGNKLVVDSAIGSCKVMNMLNTRYVKYSPNAEPMDNSKNALGNAWFVSNLQMVNTADEEMLGMKSFDPATTAIVHNEFASVAKSSSPVDSTYKIELTKYATKKLTYHSTSSAEAPVVFSEIYYPSGWVCRIDGNEVPTFRANYVLRAAMVPAGEHAIEWSFEPKEYFQSVTLNWIGSIFLLLFVLVVLGLNLKNTLREPEGSVL
jgi:hypothetical protein